MKLKSDFITHRTEDGILMISAGGGFNGMVRSNNTAADIIELLREDITREEIVEKMLAKYDADRAVLAADVDSVIASLVKIGAIDGD